VICFIGKLGQRDRRISPETGSLFQTIPKFDSVPMKRVHESRSRNPAQVPWQIGRSRGPAIS
ncbi:hypothetical protein, partial [Stutzerimonas nitrititolerans]|uniref:hypothetical protein n=1 Tax=Stutzerimonas nitrititolerans TaxID=2482751 RepID=UPI00289F156B